MNKNSKLFFEAIAYIDDRYAYGSCMDKNMLCKIDTYTGECEYVALFPNENLYCERLHMKAVTIGENIVFSPAAANNLCIYNFVKGFFTNIQIAHEESNECNSKMKFAEIIHDNKMVYVFPATYKQIIILNIDTLECEYIPVVTECKYIFRKDGLIKEKVLFLPSANSNAVMIFNIEKRCMKIVNIGEKNNGSWSICDDGKAFWIVPYIEGAVIRWDPNSNDIIEYDDYPEEFYYSKKMFIKGVYRNNIVYAIPSGANMVVAIDVKTGKMECAQKFDENEDGMLAYMGNYEDSILLMKCVSWNNWIRNQANLQIQWSVSKEQFLDTAQNRLTNWGYYIHDVMCMSKQNVFEKEISLENFLDYVINYEKYKEIQNED